MSKSVSEQKSAQQEIFEYLGIIETKDGVKCPVCKKMRRKLYDVDGETICIVCYGDRRPFP